MVAQKVAGMLKHNRFLSKGLLEWVEEIGTSQQWCRAGHDWTQGVKVPRVVVTICESIA